jgi:hypothetical protein
MQLNFADFDLQWQVLQFFCPALTQYQDVANVQNTEEFGGGTLKNRE